MRLVVATLSDSYNVQKVHGEFCHDLGIKEKNSPEKWLMRLCDQTQKYLLLMHGKKPVGMVWGRQFSGELESTLLIEGAFLRRAYRGKPKFTRELAKARRKLSHGFERVMLLKRLKADTMKKGALGVLWEVSRAS